MSALKQEDRDAMLEGYRDMVRPVGTRPDVVKALESIGGEPLVGSGFEDEEPAT